MSHDHQQDVSGTLRSLGRSMRRRVFDYTDGHEQRPLSGYAKALTAYGALVGSITLVGTRRGWQLPATVSAGDLALLSVATFRGSRILSKSAVASPLRAPLTRYVGPGGHGEVVEEVPSDVRQNENLHALGELITCPYCLGQWISTCLMACYVAAPRPTRWVAATLTVAAVSDALQSAHASAEQSAHASAEP